MIEWGLLGQRENAFRKIAELLPENCVIVETGTMRTLGNWAGDGQSTIVWNELAKQLQGQVFTIDINAECAELVDQLNLENTIAVTGDSLDMLEKLKLSHIDFLYLDSFDVDWHNPELSAKHHLQELLLALPMLNEGSLVAVDDNQGTIGKGSLVAEYLQTINAEEICTGYVRLWRMTNGN